MDDDYKDYSTEIRFTLERYEDMFSDFDPRPYAYRGLSDDFLIELKKASMEKAEENLELNLLMPEKKRNTHDELIIKNRLHDHFRRHYHLIKKEKTGVINLGSLLLLIGVIFMTATAYLIYYYLNKNFLIALLSIILEPAGWFFFWEGLNQIIFESRTKNPEFEFYHKLSNARINFIGY